LIRAFPDGLPPTTAVGLSGDCTADRETGKHFFCSVVGVSSRLRAVMPAGRQVHYSMPVYPGALSIPVFITGASP